MNAPTPSLMDDMNFCLCSAAPGAVCSFTARGERGILEAALRVTVVVFSIADTGREPLGVVITVDLIASKTTVDACRASVAAYTWACLVVTGAGGGTCSGVTSWWTVSVCLRLDGFFGAVEADVSVVERLSCKSCNNQL